jgi:hypothetical protein
MIELRLTKAEIKEIIDAITENGRYASPSLVTYMRSKELEIEA